MGFQIKRRTVAAWSLVLFSFAGTGPWAVAQQPAEKKDEPSTAKLDKKIDAQFAAAEKKVFRNRPKSHVDTKIEIVKLKRIKGKKAVKLLKILIGHRPGFAVAAVPEIDILLIRADEKTMQEAKSFLGNIDGCGSVDHRKKRPST
jgi:hypothetical protein